MKNAVIIVAYNRPVETIRLLNSVKNAFYPKDKSVDLVLSVDKGEKQDEIVAACKDFKWKNGEYKIIKRSEKMGLRPHILSCGEMTAEYDGIILLEDDLIVSPNFYLYASLAMKFYDGDDRVAQISLYSYAVNEFCSRPFYPQPNEYDVYAMKVTQSWGQCWTRRMWAGFAASKYYGMATVPKRRDLPGNINNWKENSWKKNFTNYIVDQNKYVIYPYRSFTSNYTVAGEHCKLDVPDYHVVLQGGKKDSYAFAPLDRCVVYDQFFEREGLNLDKYANKRVCVDLYASKTDFEGYDILISTNPKPYLLLDSYKLELKPHEMNLVYPAKGSDIFVYDLSVKDKIKKASNKYDMVRYDVGCIHWKRTLLHSLKGAVLAIRNRFKV